jgi:transcriptional regulator with XRE-family HTH domain
MTGEIPVGPLREAFSRCGKSLAQIAREAGCDPQHVARILSGAGQYVYRSGRRYGPYFRHAISYEMACKLADAIGVDPVDVGL